VTNTASVFAEASIPLENTSQRTMPNSTSYFDLVSEFDKPLNVSSGFNFTDTELIIAENLNAAAYPLPYYSCLGHNR
jgi:hypothetical protein